MTKHLNRLMHRSNVCLLIPFALSLVLVPSIQNVSWAEDWPTYQHDNRRSGATGETLEPAALDEAWVYRSTAVPQTAWSGPAKWDAYRNIKGLRSMREYDSALNAIVVENALYLSSSIDDSIHCINAATGEELWSYCTDGPVRIAPAYANGKVYFGSDDGHAYCLNAEDGSLVWKCKPSPEERLIPHNGKMISSWPCRSGVLVDGGKAYFACSLLPWESAFLCALDAETGVIEGDGLYSKSYGRVTMEGSFAASDSFLYVPQGRRAPRLFRRADGQSIGNLDGGGGIFVLLAPDRRIYHAPGNKTGWVTESNAETRDRVASFDRGNRLVVEGNAAYIAYDDMLVAVDRQTRSRGVECLLPLSPFPHTRGRSPFRGRRG